ncbi:flagellar protein FlgN [Halobacillus sp. A5]|uniref:flagellar protein FlgN n=1 Tax=Halobacillus sp. A5 TaxID=2880263 RepID=UPI0020A6B210|nr:flagellar protein FlgN [Halobacillus sp. A5]MCP3028100.1 flagellar protein FlgN [Halobacillus sp. A5]
MSVAIKQIIDYLERLKQLHESLLTLSKNKTEALKTNDIEELRACLNQERKHVSAIEMLEKKRIEAVNVWAAGEPGFEGKNPAVSDIIEWVDWSERKQLECVYESFILVLAELKQQEVLNGDLTRQSLQFVNMSLDLLQPTIENVNYGGTSQSSGPKRSVFDSQA